MPGERGPAYGAGPNSIAVDAKNNIAYVALYNANAIAVVDLGPRRVLEPRPGHDPGRLCAELGCAGHGGQRAARCQRQGHRHHGLRCGAPSDAKQTENSNATYYGVTCLQHPPGPWHRQHRSRSEFLGPVGDDAAGLPEQPLGSRGKYLVGRRRQPACQAGRNPGRRSAIRRKIKHVFVIIRENRTYDQILGDVAGGNGDPSLAVFGDNATYAAYPVVTPNAHALVQRFPLFDNFYDPSRQSADGHNWIVQAMAPYSDDIQSPDWLRDYPSNGGDAHCLPEEGPPVGHGCKGRRLV